jgi:uncharacterized protein
MQNVSILWRRLDLPGFESARLLSLPTGWRLEGSAVFGFEERPCRLDYWVSCAPAWETISAGISGWVGEREIQIELSADAALRWKLNGEDIPAVAGCVDLDLNFSPITNLLPIRRLDLAVGEEREVRAAWLVFPSFTLEPLEQRYRRLEKAAYRYQSKDGSFVRDLRVSPSGFILDYPGFWSVEAVVEKWPVKQGRRKV